MSGFGYAAEQLKQEGNRHFKAGEYADAADFYGKAIQKNSGNPLLYTNRANARLKLHQWQLVIDDCLRSIDLLKDNMKAYFYLCTWLQSCFELIWGASRLIIHCLSCSTSTARTPSPQRSSLLCPHCVRAMYSLSCTDRIGIHNRQPRITLQACKMGCPRTTETAAAKRPHV